MCQVGFSSLGVIIMPQSHTAGRNATERKAEYSTILEYTHTHMIQQNMNELGTNGKTLTVTEHMMTRLIVHAWQMVGLTRQLYPYSVVSMIIE